MRFCSYSCFRGATRKERSPTKGLCRAEGHVSEEKG